MFLKYALVECTVHMHEVKERNLLDKMVAECLVVHRYKVEINL